MADLLRITEVASLKGCSRKSIQRACVNGKVNTEYDPVTGEYQIYDDEKLAQWQPGESGAPRSQDSSSLVKEYTKLAQKNRV